MADDAPRGNGQGTTRRKRRWLGCLGGGALLVLVLLAAGWFAITTYTGWFLQTAIEQEAPGYIGVPVKIESSSASFDGQAELNNVVVQSPQEYAVALAKADRVGVRVAPDTLFSDTVRVRDIQIQGATLTVATRDSQSNLGRVVSTVRNRESSSSGNAPAIDLKATSLSNVTLQLAPQEDPSAGFALHVGEAALEMQDGRVRLRDLELRHPEAFAQTPMVVVPSAQATIPPGPLPSLPLELRNLQITQPTLRLIVGENTSNLAMLIEQGKAALDTLNLPAASAAPDPAADSASPATPGDAAAGKISSTRTPTKLPVMIDSCLLRQPKVVFARGTEGPEVPVSIGQIDARPADGTAQISAVSMKSPDGYATREMLTVQSISVAVDPTTLLQPQKVIRSLEIGQATLVGESHPRGSNVGALVLILKDLGASLGGNGAKSQWSVQSFQAVNQFYVLTTAGDNGETQTTGLRIQRVDGNPTGGQLVLHEVEVINPETFDPKTAFEIETITINFSWPSLFTNTAVIHEIDVQNAKVIYAVGPTGSNVEEIRNIVSRFAETLGNGQGAASQNVRIDSFRMTGAQATLAPALLRQVGVTPTTHIPPIHLQNIEGRSGAEALRKIVEGITPGITGVVTTLFSTVGGIGKAGVEGVAKTAEFGVKGVKGVSKGLLGAVKGVGKAVTGVVERDRAKGETPTEEPPAADATEAQPVPAPAP